MVRINLLVLCLSSVLLAQTDAANILVIPFLNTSHYMEMNGVAKPLFERGHNVYHLIDDHTTPPKNTPYKLVRFHVEHFLDFIRDTKSSHSFFENAQKGMNISLLDEFTKSYCIGMMSDKELFPKLESLKLDLVILDNFFVPCYFLVPYKLGVPFVSVGSGLTAWNSRLPVLASTVRPALGLDTFGFKFCEESPSQSQFVRRFCRLAAYIAGEYFPNMFDTEYLREFVDYPSISAIRENATLYLFNINFLLSSPLPKLPHVEYVGGLTTSPAKPLEESLEKWMSESANVVVVSFGSNFGSIPHANAAKIFEALGRMKKYRFVYRFKSEESKKHVVPSNVRTMDWLPQNDVLAHNSTIAFVTHSGNNGQQEALYHGVPMFCFYIFADQASNAKRVVERGFGKMMNIHEFTVDELVAELTELVENKAYSERIKKASRIFHSQKHPTERAADAVEHVLKYGGEHLRPKEAYKLEWYQFYMLDILLVLYVSLLVATFATFKTVKFLLRCCCGRKRAEKKDKKD